MDSCGVRPIIEKVEKVAQKILLSILQLPEEKIEMNILCVFYMPIACHTL